MNASVHAELIVLRNRKPLAPRFHQHIAKSKLMEQDCRVGDRVVIYEIVATRPDGPVRATGATRFEFE